VNEMAVLPEQKSMDEKEKEKGKAKAKEKLSNMYQPSTI